MCRQEVVSKTSPQAEDAEIIHDWVSTILNLQEKIFFQNLSKSTYLH